MKKIWYPRFGPEATKWGTKMVDKCIAIFVCSDQHREQSEAVAAEYKTIRRRYEIHTLHSHVLESWSASDLENWLNKHNPEKVFVLGTMQTPSFISLLENLRRYRARDSSSECDSFHAWVSEDG